MSESKLDAFQGNTLCRTTPCPECGGEAIWTQAAWRGDADDDVRAAYRCLNGHVVDPTTTRQCPACGVHDTTLLGAADGRQQFKCARCGEAFTYPR